MWIILIRSIAAHAIEVDNLEVTRQIRCVRFDLEFVCSLFCEIYRQFAKLAVINMLWMFQPVSFGFNFLSMGDQFVVGMSTHCNIGNIGISMQILWLKKTMNTSLFSIGYIQLFFFD